MNVLQQKSLAQALGLNADQILPQFNKIMRKFTKVFKTVFESEMEAQIEFENLNNKIKSKDALK